MKEATGGDCLAIGWESVVNGIQLGVIGTEHTVLEPPNPPPHPTGALMETWFNVPYTDEGDRNSLASLTRLPTYPDSPDTTDILTSVLEAPSGRGDDYGTKISTYIAPPASGEYHFYIAADNNGELWLSPSADPGSIEVIASVNGWTNPREWTKYSSQKSAAVSLVKGDIYYMEAIMKEATGGDCLAIGWESVVNGIQLGVIGTEHTVLELG